MERSCTLSHTYPQSPYCSTTYVFPEMCLSTQRIDLPFISRVYWNLVQGFSMARAVTLAPLFPCHGTIEPLLVHLHLKVTSILQVGEKLWGGWVHLCCSPVRHYPAFFFASLFFCHKDEWLSPPSLHDSEELHPLPLISMDSNLLHLANVFTTLYRYNAYGLFAIAFALNRKWKLPHPVDILGIS